MESPQSIRALFSFPGFTASSKLVGVFGDRYARVIQLKRRKKQPFVCTVDIAAGVVMTKRLFAYAISRLPDGESTWRSNAGGVVVQGVTVCM
jgi:hypothetical protein